MAWFTPEELPNNKYYIFGKDGVKRLSQEMNIPLLAQLPLVQSIREGADEGKPAVLQTNTLESTVMLEMAQNVAQQIAIRNAAVPVEAE
jgi:ATP-binding protein involved in chromosome partitioning